MTQGTATMADVAQQISDWMKAQVTAAGARGIVVGLSGGIDSAVVAALARRAVDANVLGVLMPCHSSPDAADHALLLARALAIETITVDLTTPFDALMAVLPPAEGIAPANVRPRLRMTTLYYLAAARNYIVAGTGNRSEYMVGYFTKWGDGGVDMMPIAGLYKREIRALARELAVPDVIIQKPPSADLWPGQTDEEEMGVTYDVLDRILDSLEHGDTSEFDPTKVERVLSMMRKSEHKRRAVPAFPPPARG